MNHPTIQRASSAWLFYVKTAFAIATTTTFLGIYFLPSNLWIKGFLGMAVLFLIGSTVTLSKTVRDEHEADRLELFANESRSQRVINDLSST